jgi:2-haloalkanoic acid dehalogenase type II
LASVTPTNWTDGARGQEGVDHRHLFDFALETLGLAEPSLRDRLMKLYLVLDPFPEVPEVLQQLRAVGFPTAILSNGTAEMLAAPIATAQLSGRFDHVLSVEQAGVYKPHPTVYRLACDRLGIDAGAMLFPSSNASDAHAASAFGMETVWCNRYGQNRERLPGQPDHEIGSLAELPPPCSMHAARTPVISSARRSRRNWLRWLCPHSLAAQDIALARRQHRFESGRGRQ